MISIFSAIDYSLKMCLKTLEISVLKYGLDLVHFLPAPGLAWEACLKKQA